MAMIKTDYIPPKKKLGWECRFGPAENGHPARIMLVHWDGSPGYTAYTLEPHHCDSSVMPPPLTNFRISEVPQMLQAIVDAAWETGLRPSGWTDEHKTIEHEVTLRNMDRRLEELRAGIAFLAKLAE